MSQKIRIKLKSYDHNLVDKSAEKIVKTVKSTGAVVTGPIPLPTHKKIFTVLRSPHVNKKSREQFELSSYKRLLDIYSSSPKTIDALMKLELPSVFLSLLFLLFSALCLDLFLSLFLRDCQCCKILSLKKRDKRHYWRVCWVS